jgi:hypothetical protein
MSLARRRAGECCAAWIRQFTQCISIGSRSARCLSWTSTWQRERTTVVVVNLLEGNAMLRKVAAEFIGTAWLVLGGADRLY